MSAFDLAVCTIFAREFLEGAIIIGNYRTVIQKSEEMDEADKKIKFRAINWAAFIAALVGLGVILAVAIPLGALSRNFDSGVAAIIQGVSKLVAAIAILELSLKIPGWLGIYEKVSILPWKQVKVKPQHTGAELLSLREIHFNVAWNILREVAECGVFLIPFFLQGEKVGAIPLSALVGVLISGTIAAAFFYANSKWENKLGIALLMAGLTFMLSVGLFVGGCHEFEEALCLPPGNGGVEGAPPALEGTRRLLGWSLQQEGEGVGGENTDGGAGLSFAEAEEAIAAEAEDDFQAPLPAEGASGAAEGAAAEEGSSDTDVLTGGTEGMEGAEGGSDSEVSSEGSYYCTPIIFRMPGQFWNDGRFPMVLFKPFGYSSKPTVLQMVTYWLWLLFGLALHWYKQHRSTIYRMKRQRVEAQNEKMRKSTEGGECCGLLRSENGRGDSSALLAARGDSSSLLAAKAESGRVASGQGNSGPLVHGKGNSAPLVHSNRNSGPLVHGKGNSGPLVHGKGKPGPPVHVKGSSVQLAAVTRQSGQQTPPRGHSGSLATHNSRSSTQPPPRRSSAAGAASGGPGNPNAEGTSRGELGPQLRSRGRSPPKRPGLQPGPPPVPQGHPGAQAPPRSHSGSVASRHGGQGPPPPVDRTRGHFVTHRSRDV